MRGWVWLCAVAGCGDGDGGSAGVDAQPTAPDAPRDAPSVDAPPCTILRDMPLPDTPDDSRAPTIAWDGEGFGVAWITNDDPLFTRVGEATSVNVTAGSFFSVTESAITATPGGFAVAWTGAPTSTSYEDIFVARLDSLGARKATDVPATDTVLPSYSPRLVSRSGELGRVWALSRPLTYRSLDTLVEHRLLSRRGTAHGRGGDRTLLRITAAGRRVLAGWLDTPVAHLRDVRTELLLKLLLRERAGLSNRALIEAQRAHFEPTIDALTTDRGETDVVDRWRMESARAVARFLDGALGDPP